MDDVHHRDHHAAADRAGRDRPEHGVMIPANAAALVGAGVLSVLVYPLIAIALARRGGTIPAGPDAAAAGPGTSREGGVVGAAGPRGNPAPRAKPAPRTTTAPPRTSSGSGQTAARPCLFLLDG
jgi:hypothetical protein